MNADSLILNHIDAIPRVMGCLPPKEDFGGRPKFSVTNRVIPRDQWRQVDLDATFPIPVLDQGQHGSCVGHGSTSAFWYAYLTMGGTVPPSGFSPTSLYALINGGWDRGAVVSDAMDALIEKGICTMAECPESVIYTRGIPASANETRKRFRIFEAFHCSTFDEIGSALQLGFPVSFGVMLPGGFNNLDSEGVAGRGWGILGGHCMCAYGTTRLASGKWAIRVRNSWGTRWGLSGNCLMVEEHFGRNTDAFAVVAPRSDPQDPNRPPAAIAA